jgi:hypothetical protein
MPPTEVQRAHEDGADACADGEGDGLGGGHGVDGCLALLGDASHEVERLVDEQDGVVDDDADEDDEAEHGEHVELLGGQDGVGGGHVVDEAQSREAADDGEGDAEHDDEG